MTALDDFIADARKVPLEDVFDMVGGTRRKPNISGEEVGPCPCCFGGGKDRFSLNVGKQVWSCRHYDRQGGDGLELIAHKEGLDLRRRAEFLLACSIVQGGRSIPDGGGRETDEERAEREARNAARKAAFEATRAKQSDAGERERQKAIAQGRGIFFRAGDGAGSAVERYLRLRTGAAHIPDGVWENLKFLPDHGYWHGQDERGHLREIHCGPAQIAPMIDPVRDPGHVTGCHQTWIDFARGPKFRPKLYAITGKGREAGRPALADAHDAPSAEDIEAEFYELLPSKKMRGHKKGSVIPVLGDLDAARWVIGEGIETVLGAAVFDGFRADTFYAAAGDIGNLAGPADPKSAFNHPTLKKADSKGRLKPVRVAGPVPKPDGAADCFQMPSHVREGVLLADGDSEFIKTASDMARAEARLAADGRVLATWWPRRGGDWAEMAVSAAEMMNAA